MADVQPKTEAQPAPAPGEDQLSQKQLTIPAADHNPMMSENGPPMQSPPTFEAAPSNMDPELESILFAPTQFPNEPVTHGQIGGPGADFVKGRYESDDDFMSRVATTMQERIQGDGKLMPYLDRLKRGL